MAEPLLRPGARVIADNVLHPGAPLFVHDVKDRYDLKAKQCEAVRSSAKQLGVSSGAFCPAKSW